MTERPGSGTTPEGLRMVHARYRLAAELGADRDVLELAAGPGFGLGWTARKARRVVGTDVVPALVAEARRTYGARVGLAAADAHRLPFPDGSFDLVVCFEALYYLDAAAALAECRRVLRPGGHVLLCTANKHRPGFVRSPFSRAYLDAAELDARLRAAGFDAPRLHGAFDARPAGLLDRVVLTGFAWGDRLGIIPRTLEGRARFKRLLRRPSVPLPREVGPEDASDEPLVPMEARPDPRWKVIYAVARRP